MCSYSMLWQVVGRHDVLEILTDYDYINDYIGDAGGLPETFGAEAGYGIISASKALAWVERNCPLACPGEFSRRGRQITLRQRRMGIGNDMSQDYGRSTSMTFQVNSLPLASGCK